ncbi:hypothetical protein HN51_015615 [Arachis hypogaea]|uniref:Uncharacterized protein n=2 Tax=Arachis hypogaea TaxID=3818 RepID=A0A445CJS6_ARAHY|nr:hypothetical protein Ahy_A06g026213 isoform B [Arachis hypogaea]
MMATISDRVVSNLTSIYVAVIACMKVYCVACGQNMGGAFVLIFFASIFVALILLAALAWDLSCKAMYAFAASAATANNHRSHKVCKGGICWHGVAVRSPASQVHFRLPHHLPTYPTS